MNIAHQNISDRTFSHESDGAEINPLGAFLRSLPTRLTHDENLSLTTEAYSLRRELRKLLLILPVSSQFADNWVKSVFDKRKLAKAKNQAAGGASSNFRFYRSNERRKIRVEDLIPRLAKSAAQVASGKLLENISPESGPSSVNFFAAHIERIDRLFGKYLTGEYKKKYYKSLLIEGQLGLQVADDSFGTGSVFLSDHNFESILNLALEWHQRFEDIDSRLSSLQNKFSLSDEFIQKKICKKSFLNSSSKDPELKIRDFAAEFNLVLIDIFELEKDTKLPFEVLKKILPEIKKLEIPMRELEKKVVAGNLRLVVNEAKKLRAKLGSWGQQLNINDLIQEGSFGLKKAVSRFDPGLKYKLSTFAVGWIKQSMRSSLCDQFGSVRLPNYVLLEISRLRREFQDRRNEDPDLSFSRFLEDLDKKPHTIRRIHSSFFAMNCKSIYPPVEESDRKHANLFGCDQKDTMSEAIRANLDKNFILEALSVPGLLTEIEKEVLNLRFGFSQAQELSYWEIGDLIGKSRTGAKYIEESALEKVKYYLLTNYSKHFLEN